MKQLSDAPSGDEIEVSLFGPGVGEACVVHLTSGQWLVIDSCIDRSSRENAVTSYFDRMGVDMAASVVLIVATHAHNDHIGAMSMIVERAQSAKFACSAAMSVEEFFEIREVDIELEEMRESVMDELRRVETALGDRGQAYALAGQDLFRRPPTAGHPEVRVMAISPSNEEFKNAQRRFANAFPTDGEPVRRFTQDPNEMAIALWIDIGDESVLLGSDLLSGPAPNCGWSAVVDSEYLTGKRASVFKVPHHGSPTSEHPRVWSELVAEDVVSILTPYRAGRHPRPDEADLDRISSQSEAVYITATTARPKPDAQTRARIASLTPYVQNVRDPDGIPGHVRLRKNVGDQKWKVEVAGPARKL
jgi:beta-lactamase superfamily II metal-dependent hydrolase